MKILYIVECEMYTDGDWGFDKSIVPLNYKSKYYESELYEYTNAEFGSNYHKFRRVFDTKNQAIDFATKYKESIYGDEYYKEIINELITDKIITDFCITDEGTIRDDIGNTEFYFSMYSIETNARKIKTIIYEDD